MPRFPYDPIWLTLLLAATAAPVFGQRQMEDLGRGVVAQRTGSGSTYVSWRMLGSDDEDIAFNLYRSVNGAAGVKLNVSPLTATTDYQDSPGSGILGGSSVGYYVKPVVDGVEQAASAAWTLPAAADIEPFFELPFIGDPGPDGPYDTKFVWVGDFNGDGEYDFLCDRLSTLGSGHEQFLEAYLQDGSFLWRMHMGPNSLDQSNSYEPDSSAISIGDCDNVTCFDINGDGHAEAIVRTSNGVTVKNASGTTVTTISDANNNRQFITVIDGMAGTEIDSIELPNAFLSDGPYNSRVFIAYLDGKTPSIVTVSNNRIGTGSFNRQWSAFDFDGGSLSLRWTWEQPPGVPGAEGHQIRIADVDNDGRDEIIDLGHVMDDDGTRLYVTDLTHGDRFHVADIHPLRPGLETFIIQQTNPTFLATAYMDSSTGEFYRRWYSNSLVDVARGLAIDMDPNHLGMEMFSTQPGIFNADTTEVFSNSIFPFEGLWWDGDTGREFIMGPNSGSTSPAIEKFNPATGGNTRLYVNGNNIYSWSVHNAYGGRPAFWGDILGDWREELVLTKNDYSGLRIFSSNTPAQDRRRTLMHNAQYRVQTTTKGYVQGSYVDYYLGFETTEDPPPPIDDTDHTWVGASPVFDASVCPDGESILFDLSGDNSQPVAVTGTRSPERVKVFSSIDYVFDGTAGSLSGTMDLIKAGAGSLSIVGSHDFSGPTEVWDGALIVDGTLSSTPVTIHGGTWGAPLARGETGGRLGGSGTIQQPVTLAWRGAIAPGDGNGDAATLNLAGGLTCGEDTSFSLDLSNSSASDLIAVTGDLTLDATTTLVIHPLDASLDPGTHTLVTYTGTFNGTLSDFEVDLPPGTPYSLADAGGAIQLTIPVTRSPGAITWNGGSNGNAWDLFQTANFQIGATPEKFIAGDTVTFDDTGSPNTTVTLDGDLSVGGVTVDTSLNYTFTGTGVISGSGGLTKSGSGTFTPGDGHTFTGPFTINGGTVSIAALADGGVPSSIGAAGTSSSNLVLNGATLRHDGAQTATNRGMTLGASGGILHVPGNSLQIGGTIVGSGGLTKTGAGLLLIAGSNTFSGGSHIDQGTIQLASDTANEFGLGTGSITFGGGTLSMTSNISSYNSATYQLVVPGGQTGRLNADGRCDLYGTLTGSGDFTFYVPYVRTNLFANWSAFSGVLHVICDGDGGDFRLANTAGLPNATLDLGDNVHLYSRAGTGTTVFDIGALSGSVDSTINAGGGTGDSTNQPAHWRIGGLGVDSTFEGVISGTSIVTKTGAGTLTLSGASTYSGATTVSAGRLRIDGSLSGSNVTVQNGGVLGGNGSITGNVTLNSGSGIELGATPLAITGNLTANGGIDILPLNPTAPGTYVVATYTGSFGGTPVFTWGGAGTATFSTSGNQISVTISDPASKIHHYTFNDNTFTDLVGDLDGTASGAANLSAGSLVLTGGSGLLDAAGLAIHNYASISIEFWATSNDAANTGYHALFGLGEINPANPNLASNYILLTTHRGDNVIRGAIATNNQDADPWSEEDGVSTPEINDASEHHYVLTVSGTQLELFVDGASVGQQATTQSLANVGAGIATVGALYPSDAPWQGSVDEFAIYQGVLTPAEVAAAYASGPVPNPTDSDGDLIPDDWELTYYPTVETAGPLDDTDGDGFNTWIEWKAGTNPASGASQPGNAVPGSITLEPAADAFVFQNDGGSSANSQNFGTSAELDLFQQGTGLYAFSYVRFDLGTLPSEATIDAATLTFTKVTNTNEGVDSVRNDNLTTGRFGVWGMLDVAGNTPQDWSETGITADSAGAELTGGANPQFDTATPRAVSFDGIGETVSGTGVGSTAANTDSGGGALTGFLQGRLDATAGSGLATFLVDFAEDRSATSGRGFALGSREASSGNRPTLEIDYTAGAPLPNPDEDADGLQDAWEAAYFGTLDLSGDEDGDGDGTPAWLEQALGLDPHDANDRFHAGWLESTPGSFDLTWPNGPGVTFTVESSSTLGPVWNPEASYEGAGTPATLSHPMGSLPGGKKFLRVRANPAP
ncbi:MAG: autotransporter-associated beta strand repeat-containing protein [Akkermansiaceae bacterium]|nr:autotransporter-associated beta strand repeat-containing protein [Akkermansiaceae bacterium]